jgi:hypothetical protein
VSILTPKRRVYHRWRSVLPLYDGRECPDCGVPVLGREARRVHRELHMAQQAWQEWVGDTLMQLARWTGHPVIEPARGEAGDEYGRVDLAAVELDDDEEDDDE